MMGKKFCPLIISFPRSVQLMRSEPYIDVNVQRGLLGILSSKLYVVKFVDFYEFLCIKLCFSLTVFPDNHFSNILLPCTSSSPSSVS